MKYILSLLILSLIFLQINCDKATKVVEYAKSKIGCGFSVIGHGEILTQELIKKYPPFYERAKKWIGKQTFSQAGLLYAAFNHAGIKIKIDNRRLAWKKLDWKSSGGMSSFPNKVCILYKFTSMVTYKAGIYIGNGEYIYAKGFEEGVVKEKMPGDWTLWAIPKGLYDDESIQDKPEEKITSFPCVAKVIVSSGKTVDIRKSPSKNSSILLRIKFGENVIITGKENNWYKVTYGGTSGYIMKEFVRKV